MHYRQIFTLTKRNFGKKDIYYYLTYDENGKRVCFSTGLTSKTAAQAYCMELYKKGLLIPKRQARIKFAEFAVGFWNYETSTYIQGTLARGGSFGQAYAHSRQLSVEKHILPFFGDKYIDMITPADVDRWLLSFKAMGLSNTTANHNLVTLRIMLEEAVKSGFAVKNPCDGIKPLHENAKTRGILTLEEARELLNPDNYLKYWDNGVTYAGNFLAAITGLRLGEVLALRWEDIHDGYIAVTHSFNDFGIKDTKTHRGRNVPIPPLMFQILTQIAPHNGFIFSVDGGLNPIQKDKMHNDLYRALRKMGIDAQQRKNRNICFHSWRHFFNTTLRAGNIPDAKTQALTGHSTQEMTEHYTHFQASDFNDVRQIQSMIIGSAS